MTARAIRRCQLSAMMIAAAALFASAADAKIQVGQPAPEFIITKLDGRTVKLADMRGKVVVINFWATWCAPCKVEMPLLDTFQRKFRDTGFEVYAIATMDSAAKYHMRKIEKSFALTLGSLSGSRYARVTAIPTNYVIDRSGVVRYAKAGALTLDRLNALLGPLLREPVPQDAGTAPAGVQQTAAR